MPRPAAIMSRSLQRERSARAMTRGQGRTRGLIANGELPCEQALDAFPTMPGSARGRTWLGQIEAAIGVRAAAADGAAVDERDLPARLRSR